MFHTSAWTNKYLLLYHEGPPKLPGCSWWERSHLYLRRGRSDLLALLWFGYYPLPDQYCANRKPQVQAGVKLSLLLVSRNWRGCCLSRTEKLLLSSVVCSGRTKEETFKSSNENQEPKSHWLLMKVRGRRFCCASETSSFSIVQLLNCWWWMRSACATFWTPTGTKVTWSYVCCVAWAKHRSPLLASMEEWLVITPPPLFFSSVCCRASWEIKALRTCCLVTLCCGIGYLQKTE